MRCPGCSSLMQEGFISVKDGLLWLRNANGPGLQFAEAIGGTQAIMRPNHLTAWRCQKCELITFEYGRRHEERQRRAAETSARSNTDPADI